jgi:hypothetical protein
VCLFVTNLSLFIKYIKNNIFILRLMYNTIQLKRWDEMREIKILKICVFLIIIIIIIITHRFI